MTIATIRARLKLLQESIPGITRAYEQLPRGMVKTQELPTFITFVRNSTYDLDTLGDNDLYIRRNFLMWLLVKPVAEGEEFEGESLVEPWIDTITQFFFARPSLGLLAGVQNSFIAEDSGPKKLVWPGTPGSPIGSYWGVEFRITVIEYEQRTFATNE